MDNLHDMIDRGLAFVTGAMTGASGGIDGRLTGFNDDVRAHDDAIFQWQLAKYGPAGLTGRKPDSDLIAAEQYFYTSWKKWIDTWDDTKKAAEKQLEVARTFAGGETKDLITEIDRAIDRKKVELKAWKERFTEVKATHEKAEKAGTAPAKDVGPQASTFPWGKVLIGSVVIVGAGFAVSKYMRYRTRKELELADSSRAVGRAQETIASQRMPPPMPPQLAMAPIPSRVHSLGMPPPPTPMAMIDGMRSSRSPRTTLISGSAPTLRGERDPHEHAPQTVPTGVPSAMSVKTIPQV